MLRTITSPRTVVSRLAALAAAGLFALTAASAFAQNDAQSLTPSRITQPINQDVRVTLKNNVHPLAQAKYDQGAAPGSMSTGRIMLVLKRSDTQENALKQYLGDLQNPHSASYRKWLTPAQYGKQYGISDTDLTTVTAWLQSQGFTVAKIPQARNVVEFSGNVAQVQQAFNTSIHRYVINGETHFANSTDPQIPTALAPVVAGIASLNDFRPRAHAVKGPTGHFDPETKTIKPDLTIIDTKTGQQFLYVNPADAATIYDTTIPALNAAYKGAQYDGSGVTIGIAGDSNVTAADISNYRAAFLPSTYTNQPNIIIDGNDPGINGDAVEALLDMEISGGIAPGATVNFYTSANTDLQSGLFLAIYRALDDNAVSILNVSFGACEASQLTSGNLQILNAWEQAAAQGISVTVSTGDSGSAGCDNPNTETVATNGLAVSGMASTPYNIAVGGTDFDVLGSSFSQYVSATNSASNYYGTALGYIPEDPWNDSPKTNGAISANAPFTDANGHTNIVGAGGGISSCTQATSATDAAGNTVITCTANSGYAQPAFQKGLVTNYSVRAVPDVSLLAADQAYGATWVVCGDGNVFGDSTTTDCSGSPTSSQFTVHGVGGTSAASPAFAGVLALVAQSQGGARLGQADSVLYNLASQPSLYGTVFHDVTTGNNSVYCSGGATANCGSNSFLTGYDTATGYDAATGLGSVDVAQLVANWNNAVFTATTTGLTINGSTSAVNVPHGQLLNFAVSVNPGTATGDVAVVNNNMNNASNGAALQNGGLLFSNGQNFLTVSGGQASGTANTLPGGIYTVSARYGGDTTNASSTSNGISVNITPENSTTSLSMNIYDAATGSAYTGPATSVPYGLYNFAVAQPYGNASVTNANGTITPDGVPTGTVSFFDNNKSLATSQIASNGAATYTNDQIPSQSMALGTHSITAQYSGDASFNASTSNASQTFTVVQAATTTSAASSANTVASAANVTITVAVAADSLGVPPSGSVQLFKGSTALGNTATLTQGYSSTTGLAQSTATFTFTGSQLNAANIDHSGFPWTLSTTGATALACVLFFAIPARRRSWRGLLGLIVFAVTLSAVIGCGSSSKSNPNPVGGTASITAKYSGDGNYTASTSTAITVTITQ